MSKFYMGQVGGIGKNITANVTRPADTTAYTAGDVLSDSTSAPTVLTFSGVTRIDNFGSLLIGATCVSSANQATKPNLELWLFSASPTAMEDNDVFDPTDAEMRNVVAVVTFPISAWLVGTSTVGAGGNAWAYSEVYPDRAMIESAASSTALYGIVVVRNAYTPVSAERFDFSLQVSQE